MAKPQDVAEFEKRNIWRRSGTSSVGFTEKGMKMSTQAGRLVPTIVESLRLRAAASPDALAYDVEGDALTFGQLLSRVAQAAGNLSDLGLGAGNICVLVLPTSLDFITTLFAVQWLGAIPVALNPALSVELIHRRAELVRAAMMVCDDETIGAVGNIAVPGPFPVPIIRAANLLQKRPQQAPPPPAGAPERIAYLQFTSGTTGAPKIAAICHRSLIASLEATARRIGIDQRDVLASWLPLYHDLGLVRFVFGAIYYHCAAYLLRPSIQSLQRWLPLISRVRATITSSPDFGYRIASRTTDPARVDLRCLRIATNGGEVCRLSTICRFEKRFGLSGIIRPAYGLAEATLGVSMLAPGEPLYTDQKRNVSCGRPLDGIETKIVGDDGKTLPIDAPGEIWIRGQPVFSGYLGDTAASEDIFTDGWLRTGDIGALDGNGHLYILGRKRALIKRAGALIIPREIEEAADRTPGVRFSAAIGHDADDGNDAEALVVVAEIRPADAPGQQDRKAIAAGIGENVRKAVGFSPAEVVLTAPRTIPRTRNGKIRYPELRQRYVSGKLFADGRVLYGDKALVK